MFVFVMLPLLLQLDQMDLEVHDIPQDTRSTFKKRLTSYKHELERLKKDFVSFFIHFIVYDCNFLI